MDNKEVVKNNLNCDNDSSGGGDITMPDTEGNNSPGPEGNNSSDPKDNNSPDPENNNPPDPEHNNSPISVEEDSSSISMDDVPDLEPDEATVQNQWEELVDREIDRFEMDIDSNASLEEKLVADIKEVDAAIEVLETAKSEGPQNSSTDPSEFISELDKQIQDLENIKNDLQDQLDNLHNDENLDYNENSDNNINSDNDENSDN
jgi:hypothetical protein